MYEVKRVALSLVLPKVDNHDFLDSAPNLDRRESKDIWESDEDEHFDNMFYLLSSENKVLVMEFFWFCGETP